MAGEDLLVGTGLLSWRSEQRDQLGKACLAGIGEDRRDLKDRQDHAKEQGRRGDTDSDEPLHGWGPSLCPRQDRQSPARARGYTLMARESTISKALSYGGGSPFAMAIGQALRNARRRRRFTQAQLGAPFSGAFVSRVEKGDALPSLPALAFLLRRLDLTLGEFFEDVAIREGHLVVRAQAEERGTPERVSARPRPIPRAIRRAD